jgi:hypothetical protein
MRAVVLQMGVSLDGYVAGLGGDLDWGLPPENDAVTAWKLEMDWTDAYLVAFVELRHLDGLLSFDRLDAKIAGLPVTRREP